MANQFDSGSTGSTGDVRHRRSKEKEGSKVFMFSMDRLDGVKAGTQAMTEMDGDSSSLSVPSSHQPLCGDRLQTEGGSNML